MWRKSFTTKSAHHPRGCHIVNPFTGRPAVGLASVTVVGPELTYADAYATAAFAMGSSALAWAEAFGADILRACVEFGGVLTGEHGVGIEKRDLMPEMFSEIDLNQQQRLKCAFDAQGLLNPGKVFPTLHRCAELGRVHVHGGRLAFPELPRF